MPTQPVSTRLPTEVADHVEHVANSPVTEQETPSAVLRDIVTDAVDET